MGNYTHCLLSGFQNHSESTKHPTCKSSYMTENVPQQASKSTNAIHSTKKTLTAGNVPKGRKYCSLFALCEGSKGAQITGSECNAVRYRRMMSSYSDDTSHVHSLKNTLSKNFHIQSPLKITEVSSC